MRYNEGVDGGRVTPEGKTLKWKLTAPVNEVHGVGNVPFFCGDVTPRDWRVSTGLLIISYVVASMLSF